MENEKERKPWIAGLFFIQTVLDLGRRRKTNKEVQLSFRVYTMNLKAELKETVIFCLVVSCTIIHNSGALD